MSWAFPSSASTELSDRPQYDIELIHNIEQYTGTPLDLCPEVEEDDVLKLLNQVAKASRVAKMRLMEQVGSGGRGCDLWGSLRRRTEWDRNAVKFFAAEMRVAGRFVFFVRLPVEKWCAAAATCRSSRHVS